MSELFAARAQMATSLAFHIVFAALGMGLPLLLVVVEGIWLRTGNPVYLALARRWAKGLAVLFAVGAVSGTILSFELGLLWPRFMEFAGGIIGMPFSAEGFAFFVEAIFLGLYLYGWDRLSPRAHWLCGIPIAISGALSGVFVVAANSWMNAPAGFRLVDGRVVDVDPVAAMFNSGWFPQALHMLLAAYVATGFGVAGLYAIGLARGRRDEYHRAGLTVAMALAAVTAMLQAISGDIAARWVAENQPIKLAAMEGQFVTEAGAPLRIGGWPDPESGETRYALELPGLLSLLAYGDPDATVRGLEEWPASDVPDARIVHPAFQLMVGIGVSLIVLGVWYWFGRWRARRRQRDPTPSPLLLRLLALATPLGFVAIEAGWTVTEVGRQPWIIYGVMRTEDAVTSADGLVWSLGVFTLVYLVLAAATTWLLLRIGRHPLEIPAPGARPDDAARRRRLAHAGD